MPLDILPAKLFLPSRDQERDTFKRNVLLRLPGVDTREGSQADLDANVFADSSAPLFANAVIISNGVSRSTATGTRLDDWATALGTVRQSPTGGEGFVTVSTNSTGATIFAGDVLTHAPTGFRFQVTDTAVYTNGAQVPISGIDVGPLTNLASGSILTWQAPRPGVSINTATVVQQADGSGLSGGANLESDQDLRVRLDFIASNPPASGNDAQIQALVVQTPAISIQQAFTYPAVKGPGTTGITFTLVPNTPGANRIPNSAQLASMVTYLGGQLPVDMGVFSCTLVANAITVVLKALWAQSVPGWVDATTFPQYFASPNLVNAVANASSVLSATAFRLTSPSLTSSSAPQVGQSIGFYDLIGQVFRRKKILTVTTISSTQYDVTVDVLSGVSDTSYTPTAGQACCPWSDSLNTVITPVLAYFDTLGPGEQVVSLLDPGLRQRRSPINPQLWPSTVTNRLIGGAITNTPPLGPAQNIPAVPTLLSTSSLQDVILQEPTIPYATPVGTPGVSSNLTTLGNLVVFPE